MPHFSDAPDVRGLPKADALHRLLREAHKPLPIDAIMRMLGAQRRLKKPLEKLLQDMLEQGQVQRLRGGVWMAAELLRSMEGRFSVLRSGDAVVTPFAPVQGRGTGKAAAKNAQARTGKADARRDEAPQPVFIHPAQTGGAWHGDTVRVTLFPPRRGHGPEGRVTEILERAQAEIAAYVCKARPKHRRAPRLVDAPATNPETTNPDVTGFESTPSPLFVPCTPADPRLPFQLSVDVSTLPAVPEPGSLILTRPVVPLASDLWQAVAVRAFGREDDIAVQEHLVKCNHQTPVEFPPDVLAAAAALPSAPDAADMTGREDVRDLPLVTIDGATAHDFDDAIFVEPQGKGWRLLVGIADVTHYVRPRSPLDAEARERGNSWYFPTSVEPMLPKALSNGLCSLNPGEDRLIMLAEMTFDAQGNSTGQRFAPAVMRSHARLTYDAVKTMCLDADPAAPAAREALAGTLGAGEAATVLAMLDDAFALARVLARRRTERGSLDFNLPEPEYTFDAQGRVVAIGRKVPHFAHRLIEECMIAANEAVARFLTERKVPFVYRVHPEPDPARLDALWRTLSTTELAAHLPPKAGPELIRVALEAAKDGPQEFFASRLALRTMPQARYEVENIGHYGLASTCYCHFTSPIRRYADVIVHRALKHVLDFDAAPIPAGKQLLAQADHINRCERAAMEAEREMTRRCAALLLRQHVGEEFEGTVAGVTDFGCFVELDAMPVEGMVRVDSLGDDYFAYDPERQELTGVVSGLSLGLGQKVRVRLLDVNLGRLEITLELVSGLTGRGTHGDMLRASSRKGNGRAGKGMPRRGKAGRSVPSQGAMRGGGASGRKGAAGAGRSGHSSRAGRARRSAGADGRGAAGQSRRGRAPRHH